MYNVKINYLDMKIRELVIPILSTLFYLIGIGKRIGIMIFKKRVKDVMLSVSEFLELCGKREQQENFKDDREYMYHQYNICYPIWKSETAKIISKYFSSRYDNEIRSVKATHNPDKASGFPRETFYQCIEAITEEEKYYVSGKPRLIKDKEFIFVLNAICSRIHSDNEKKQETFLSHKYFTCDKTKEHYFKYTGKMPNRTSIAHIFRVLENRGLIHRKKLKRKTTRFLVGKNNPLYLLELFPNIKDNNIIELPFPQKIKELESRIAELESQVEKNKWSILNKPVVEGDFDRKLKLALKS